MPIVVSILERSADALLRAAERAAPDADALELRLDALDAAAVEALAPRLRALGKPVIAAVHGAEGFGTFAGPLEARFELLRAAAHAGAAFVDVDARFAAAFGPAPAGARRIVSHHEKEGTPPELAALFDRVERAAASGDVVKVVTHAACAEDGLRVLSELRARVARDAGRERTAFCSGERGAFTRVLAPLAGARFTYAAPADGARTAPGQLDARALRAALASARTLRPPVAVWAGSALAATRWFAVLGRPVAHSWSPRLHGAVFRALARDAVYVACEPDDVAHFLALARELPFEGFSITAPFKTDALRAASEVAEDAAALGAANTIVRTESGWRASNTDAPAVRAALASACFSASKGTQSSIRAGGPVSASGTEAHGAALGTTSARGAPLGTTSLHGARALVVGAGGAARAAVWALVGAGAEVAVHARRGAEADTLASAFGARSLTADAVVRERFDVLVHATPAGSRASADACAVPVEWLSPGMRVLDAVYRPAETELLRRARARGCVAVPGTTWFALQARLQAALFVGRVGAERVDAKALEAALAAELESLSREESEPDATRARAAGSDRAAPRASDGGVP
ncbi:MAG: type I 3-dehydroquinate dehydratase [Planctomycetes bacterium]|nr:type I 3-dehydroquinate dehydratase [Planctomycetota bacterium]